MGALIAAVADRPDGQAPDRQSLELNGASAGAPIELRFLTERRFEAAAYGAALGVAGAIALLLLRHDWWRNPDGNCTDFIWIWLSSRFALAGELVRAYDYSAFSAVRSIAAPASCSLEHFDYPPTLLFFTYPLGLMPYPVAFAIWMISTLFLYLSAVYAIVRRRIAVVAALACYPVFSNVVLGHDGFLTAGLFGFALLLMERRPSVSGIFLGLLTYKPQFGILFPLALLASRNWRALLSAAAASVILGGAALAFGRQAWPAFVGALTDRALEVSRNPRLDLWLASVFGILRTMGIGAGAAWTAQIAASALVAVTICILWARRIPHSLKAAALAAASLLASPHFYPYDVCILTIGVAFFIQDVLARGFLRGERAALLISWAALFAFWKPIPAIICWVLLILIVRRAARFPAIMLDHLPASGRRHGNFSEMLAPEDG